MSLLTSSLSANVAFVIFLKTVFISVIATEEQGLRNFNASTRIELNMGAESTAPQADSSADTAAFPRNDRHTAEIGPRAPRVLQAGSARNLSESAKQYPEWALDEWAHEIALGRHNGDDKYVTMPLVVQAKLQQQARQRNAHLRQHFAGGTNSALLPSDLLAAPPCPPSSPPPWEPPLPPDVPPHVNYWDLVPPLPPRSPLNLRPPRPSPPPREPPPPPRPPPMPAEVRVRDHAARVLSGGETDFAGWLQEPPQEIRGMRAVYLPQQTRRAEGLHSCDYVPTPEEENRRGFVPLWGAGGDASPVSTVWQGWDRVLREAFGYGEGNQVVWERLTSSNNLSIPVATVDHALVVDGSGRVLDCKGTLYDLSGGSLPNPLIPANISTDPDLHLRRKAFGPATVMLAAPSRASSTYEHTLLHSLPRLFYLRHAIQNNSWHLLVPYMNSVTATLLAAAGVHPRRTLRAPRSRILWTGANETKRAMLLPMTGYVLPKVLIPPPTEIPPTWKMSFHHSQYLKALMEAARLHMVDYMKRKYLPKYWQSVDIRKAQEGRRALRSDWGRNILAIKQPPGRQPQASPWLTNRSYSEMLAWVRRMHPHEKLEEFKPYTDRNMDRAWNSTHMEAPVIQFGRAKVVIGVPGGALANIIFCSRGTQVIIMHSGQREMGFERFQRLAQKHGLGVHEVVIKGMQPNRLFDVPKGVILQAVKAALADWEAKPASCRNRRHERVICCIKH
ncbi:hypothetical protein CYMTET_28253 [Cymbomonas tetramitiformis]|uniref:Uncharacterized protein n=1 Tax=Cymbomonas tetramitiformis TaxID=36881 RepID=A0AAE0FN97_9CHLO|nr:hypothetical protein CYMTET_28253 [Cymbomonas tetramitiformis]